MSLWGILIIFEDKGLWFDLGYFWNVCLNVITPLKRFFKVKFSDVLNFLITVSKVEFFKWKSRLAMTYSKRGHLRFSKNICVICISTNKNVRAFFLKIKKKKMGQSVEMAVKEICTLNLRMAINENLHSKFVMYWWLWRKTNWNN